MDHGEGAFAAGLFHDLGWLLVALGCPEEYEQASRLFLQNEPNGPECELEILGISHAELSAEALAVWNLPQPIETAVRYHALPEQDPKWAGTNRIPLSRILNAADYYVQQRGNHLSIFEQGVQNCAELPDFLGLGEQLPRILNDFDAEFSTIQQFF